MTPSKYIHLCYCAACPRDARARARVARRGAKRTQLKNVAAAEEVVGRPTQIIRKVPAALPLKFRTNTNAAAAAEIMHSARVVFLSAAENGAAQNNF